MEADTKYNFQNQTLNLGTLNYFGKEKGQGLHDY